MVHGSETIGQKFNSDHLLIFVTPFGSSTKHKLQVAQTIANLYVLDKPNSIGCNLQLNTKSSLLAT